MNNIPASGLTLSDNLLLNNMTLETWNENAIATDWGYNKIQTFINIANKNGSIAVDNFKQDVAIMGKIGISNTVSGASTLSGSNLIVTMQNPDTRWRVKDLVGDSNLVKGRVIQVISSTQLLLEPSNVTSWNVSTNFTSGMNMTNFGDVSGLGTTTGKTSLSYSPSFDHLLVECKRDTYQENKADRRYTKIKYNGKFWYTTQQMYLLQNFMRAKELQIVFSDRVENFGSTIEGNYNTTGGIRWSAKSNGGTYMPVSSVITESMIQDFIYEMANKFATNGQQKNLVFFVGRDAMGKMQNFLTPNIQYAGKNNCFGGADVKGYDTRTYSWAGITFDVQLYDMFNDDATWGTQVSSVTGRNKMASTIMAIDMSPAASANGEGTIPVIRPYHYSGLGAEMLFKFIPGMIGSQTGTVTAMPGNSIQGDNFSLSTSALDASSWELERCDGVYVIPEKVGWLELV